MENKVGMAKKWLNKGADLTYTLVLAVIALGTLTLAIQLSLDIWLDFIHGEDNGLAYTISELMYPLIVIELFRQIIRQIRNEPFSLKPFISICVIVSVRSMIVTQIKLSDDEVNVQTGYLTILALALVILLLVASYYLCHKSELTDLRCDKNA